MCQVSVLALVSDFEAQPELHQKNVNSSNIILVSASSSTTTKCFQYHYWSHWKTLRGDGWRCPSRRTRLQWTVRKTEFSKQVYIQVLPSFSISKSGNFLFQKQGQLRSFYSRLWSSELSKKIERREIVPCNIGKFKWNLIMNKMFHVLLLLNRASSPTALGLECIFPLTSSF